MKRFISTILLCLTTTFAFAKVSISPEDTNRLSEALGHFLVRNLSNPSLSFAFNFDKVIQGMKDAQAGKDSPMKEEEYEQMLASLQESLFEETADKNLSEANAFLQENASSAGICILEDKLQYKVLKEGTGLTVQNDSVPLIHYKGSLLDGTVFANSQEAGAPITLPIAQTIPGFAKGLVGMKEGEKRTLYIHPELAYGVAGHLPPNSLLIFDVEIVQVNPPKEAPPNTESAR